MKGKKAKKRTGKIIALVIVAVIVIGGAVWAKDYYNKRYVTADVFYTQIPTDEVNEDSWLEDDQGEQFTEGKQYRLVGYNKDGEKRNVSFFARGKAEDYYAPGSFIRVEVSETIEVGESVVPEGDVPQEALKQIQKNGTKTEK